MPAKDLDAYVQELTYDPRRLLSVTEDGSTSSLPATDRQVNNNAVIICTTTQHSLRKNLSDVAILNPGAGVVFPGALVLADQNLMDGKPTPISLPRAPVTLTVDLPGLANPKFKVAEPTNSSVQTGLNGLLEEWNEKPVSQGYVNAARSYLEVKTVYSAQQVALELGFSAKWTGGSAASQLNASSDSRKSVVLAFYKQVFYTVTMDNPAQPSSVFANSVSRRDLERVSDAEHPPAYVRSVDYGRILLVKMETSSVDTKSKLTAAFNQVTQGGAELEGNADASYAEIVKNSTFTVVAIGGGASTAANTFSGSKDGITGLREYIRQDATYRRDNPGLPISYAVAFLKDGQLAQMGFTTDYTETDCVRYPNGFVRLQHAGAYVAKFEVTWEAPDAQGAYVPNRWESGDKTAGYTQQIDLPGDAHNVHLKAWAATGLIWDPWGEALNVTEAGPSNKLYKITGTTLSRSREIVAAS